MMANLSNELWREESENSGSLMDGIRVPPSIERFKGLVTVMFCLLVVRFTMGTRCLVLDLMTPLCSN